MNQVAAITEACVGCTKCLRICPTGAIKGARKQLHRVEEENCTGCGLCVPVCPVACISLVGGGEALPTTPLANAPHQIPTVLPADLLQKMAEARQKAQSRHAHLAGVKKAPPGQS